jgi:hypothetical protein
VPPACKLPNVATPDPAERHLRARLHPVGDEVPSPEPPWLATLPHGEPGLSRVAALGQTAQAAMRAGQARECLAALDEQRAAAGGEPAALVWALTVSAVCRATLGQLTRSRADLAEARQNCLYAAPLLAQPFWQFVEIVCNWLGGNWSAASSDASALYADQVAPITPALSGVILALRAELLRGLGLAKESRMLAGRLPPTAPAELCVWVRAGLDADDGHGAEALRDLADVYNVSTRSMFRGVLPLVLHRMATIAFGRGDRGVTASAAARAGSGRAADRDPHRPGPGLRVRRSRAGPAGAASRRGRGRRDVGRRGAHRAGPGRRRSGPDPGRRAHCLGAHRGAGPRR